MKSNTEHKKLSPQVDNVDLDLGCQPILTLMQHDRTIRMLRKMKGRVIRRVKDVQTGNFLVGGRR